MTDATAPPATDLPEPTKSDAQAARSSSLNVIGTSIDSLASSATRLQEAVKQGASAYIAGLGTVLTLLAVVSRVDFGGYQLARFGTGEIITLLAVGLALLLVGVGFRMFMSWSQVQWNRQLLQERLAKWDAMSDEQRKQNQQLLDSALRDKFEG